MFCYNGTKGKKKAEVRRTRKASPWGEAVAAGD